jgi:hypothetical protein
MFVRERRPGPAGGRRSLTGYVRQNSRLFHQFALRSSNGEQIAAIYIH